LLTYKEFFNPQQISIVAHEKVFKQKIVIKNYDKNFREFRISAEIRGKKHKLRFAHTI
jgi:hypothetical protein